MGENREQTEKIPAESGQTDESSEIATGLKELGQRLSELSSEQKEALKVELRTNIVLPMVAADERGGRGGEQLGDSFDAFVDSPTAEAAAKASEWSFGAENRYSKFFERVATALETIEKGK